ncbi:MAG: serine protease, partial [Achromobacter sp.]|nr:serine protease [Achromobacter sp.]
MKRIALLVASTLLVTPVLAQAPAGGGPRVPASRAEIGLSFAPVVARTAPAIVNVYAQKTAPRNNPLLDDPFF